MAIQAFIHDCACKMLGVPELPLDLRNYLDEVEMFCNLAGSTVASRQIVGLALANYRDRQILLDKIKKLENEQ